MDVVLSILQVFLWIVFALLAVCLLIILAILFVPVRYEAEGDVRENSWFKAKIHWLLHLFRIKASYDDDLIFIEIAILWLKKTYTFELNKEEDDVEDEAEETKETIREETENGMITKIKGIINRIKDILPKVKKIITDERNKAAVVHLKDELLYLVKILLPKKSKVDARFSTGSPDTTGQTYGILACFPVVYQDSWNIFPDFNAQEPYFYGTFWGKGRFYGYQVIGIILRIVFDKNCQRLYTMVNKFIKYVKRK